MRIRVIVPAVLGGALFVFGAVLAGVTIGTMPLQFCALAAAVLGILFVAIAVDAQKMQGDREPVWETREPDGD